ncbi:hypothetical protein P691DRAFT_797781 [Macrolepiota fuliginosa MF-IS2]|uniref:Uncharacterized protein n=1 Tax=Macrolepiota fuliginosa MF-IS2 TaxID=1400762 RepID=A0A9P5X2P7_9AGAR|nr:hypothetical protein P691DRAFT_797781 [Macrolepiota fuliginosa MF-IS2]
MARTHVSVNASLFQSTELPYSSKPLEVWKDALACYTVPPLHIFCGEDDKKTTDLMLGWLVVCISWMGTLSGAVSCVALGLELTQPDSCKLPSASPAPAKELSCLTCCSTKSKEAAKEIFTIHIPSRKALQFMAWHDHVVWQHGQLDFPEHNFHLEFLTLDHCILASAWVEMEGAAVQEVKFNGMWPDEAVIMAELLEDGSIRIAVEDWKKRAQFTEALHNIIIDWPGEIPGQLSQLSFHQQTNGQDIWDKSVMKKVEALASKHYCQTFFDYFGQAPCIPCTFPTA